VESAVAEALDGVNARDRTATRRVLERLAGHLGSAVGRQHPPRSGNANQAGREKAGWPDA
jgi:hypothetical protein